MATKTNEIVIDKEDVSEASKKSTTTKKAVKKFAPDDRIECRSVTGGELILVGPKTGLYYSWEDYGDKSYVEYQDLQALQSRRSSFLIKPRFIIENADLVEQWASMLKPIYSKITEQSIEEFFELPQKKFEAQLKTMPDGLKDAVKTKAVQMIINETLYDIRKITAIDKAWGTELVNMLIS